MPDLLLELYLPMSGTVSRACASVPEAITAAASYFAGFPGGLAEIRDGKSGHVVMAPNDLRAACGDGDATSPIRLLQPVQRRR